MRLNVSAPMECQAASACHCRRRSVATSHPGIMINASQRTLDASLGLSAGAVAAAVRQRGG